MIQPRHVVHHAEIGQTASGNRQGDCPFRLGGGRSHRILADQQLVVSDDADRDGSIGIVAFHLCPVRHRQRLAGYARGVYDRIVGDQIRGVSVGLRRIVFPTDDPVLIGDGTQSCPGNEPVFGRSIRKGHFHGDAAAGKMHELLGIASNIVQNGLSADGQLVIRIDANGPGYRISVFPDGDGVPRLPLSDLLKIDLSGKVGFGGLSLRHIIADHRRRVFCLCSGSGSRDEIIVHGGAAANRQHLSVNHLGDCDAEAVLHRLVIGRYGERPVYAGLHHRIPIEMKGGSDQAVLNHHIPVQSLRADLQFIVRRIAVLVIDYAFRNSQIRRLFEHKIFYDILVENDLSQGLIKGRGDRNIELNIGHRLQTRKIRVVLIEANPKLTANDLEKIVTDDCRSVLILNGKRKGGRPNIVDQNALREVVEKHPFIVELQPFVFAESQRHFIGAVGIDDDIPVFVHGRFDGNPHQEIRKVAARCRSDFPCACRRLRRGHGLADRAGLLHPNGGLLLGARRRGLIPVVGRVLLLRRKIGLLFLRGRRFGQGFVFILAALLRQFRFGRVTGFLERACQVPFGILVRQAFVIRACAAALPDRGLFCRRFTDIGGSDHPVGKHRKQQTEYAQERHSLFQTSGLQHSKYLLRCSLWILSSIPAKNRREGAFIRTGKIIKKLH